jgi:transcriptional regulator GlxA family with amidase domain
MGPKHIGLIGFSGVTASHLSVPADAFTAAQLDDGFGGRIACYRTWLIGLTTKAFETESGIVLQPQATLESAPALDTIIIAGGRGAVISATSEKVAEWILKRGYQTRRIASIGTGISPLAFAGLLDGREVTTHWHLAREFSQRHPSVRVNHKRRLIKDGAFYTAAGLTAGLDLALALIEEDYGNQLALLVGRELMTYLPLESEPGDSVVNREANSRPIDRFGDLVPWIMRNLHQDLTVDLLARQACMCPAHFTRAFKSVFGATPGDFVENLRLNEARRRLASPGKTLGSVAQSVGFSNPETFRRAFERRFGAAPSSQLHSDLVLQVGRRRASRLAALG